MPSFFAYIMLLAWLPFTAILFGTLRMERAVILSLLLGYLFLPGAQAALDLPVLPALDRTTIPALMTTLCWAVTRRRANQRQDMLIRRAKRRGEPIPDFPNLRGYKNHLLAGLFLLFLAGSYLTYSQNQYLLIYGPRFISGMSLYDTASMIQSVAIMLLPLWLARKSLLTQDALVFLLKTLVVLGLVYSILILFEARMSPQLHKWIYGYNQHSWIQHVRGGHFRAMVFLNHGLRVGIFIAMALVAAGILYRIEPDRRRAMIWIGACLWLLPILYLSRNLGASLLALLFLPVALFFPPRLQLVIAAMVAAMTLSYPMARGAGLVPIETLISNFERVSPGRAQSLQFRLDHEDKLLEHANEKPWGGWGIWGRNRIYNERTGRDMSVTDGSWVITIGIHGWLGYIAIFGMVCLPPILLALRRVPDDIAPVAAGMSVVLSVNLIDMLPNSSMVTPLWLITGALWVCVERTRAAHKQPKLTARERRQQRLDQGATPSADPRPVGR